MPDDELAMHSAAYSKGDATKAKATAKPKGKAKAKMAPGKASGKGPQRGKGGKVLLATIAKASPSGATAVVASVPALVRVRQAVAFARAEFLYGFMAAVVFIALVAGIVYLLRLPRVKIAYKKDEVVEEEPVIEEEVPQYFGCYISHTGKKIHCSSTCCANNIPVSIDVKVIHLMPWCNTCSSPPQFTNAVILRVRMP